MRLEVVDGDGRGVGPVTENDLETVVNLNCQIEHKQDLLARLGDSILDRLASGAEVEIGPRYASREIVTMAGVVEERLFIDSALVYRRFTGGHHRLKRRR